MKRHLKLVQRNFNLLLVRKVHIMQWEAVSQEKESVWPGDVFNLELKQSTGIPAAPPEIKFGGPELRDA
jgi:ubiquitin-protein ligase